MSSVDREALIAEALLHRPDRTDQCEWWRGAMFYEVYLRSFNDTTGDGIGDLAGVTQKLDYIASLNVDGVWISPFYPSAHLDFGYDVTDFCNVDPQFGTMGDFLELLEGAHDRGLKLLIDTVPGHTSDQHPWFRESRESRDNPKANWFIWADATEDGGPPNNWLSSFGGSAWQWEPRRSQYYYHPFLTCQPALNLVNHDTLEAVINVFRFWMDQGVDGFRLDAVQCLSCDPTFRNNPPSPDGESNIMVGGGPNNPFRKQLHQFDRDVPASVGVMEQMRQAVEGYEPQRVLIGELADVDSSRVGAKYTMQGKRLHAVYDFDLINGANSLNEWRNILNVRSEHMASGWTMNVFTNHDSIRAVSNLTVFAEEHGDSKQAAKLLLFLQTTLLGGAILFQGEELGLPQPKLSFEDLQDPWGKNLWPDFEGRDPVRTPIPWNAKAKHGGFSKANETWLPVAKEHLPLAVDGQEKDKDSVLNFLRRILKWRKTEPVLRLGKEKVYESEVAPVIAYDRFDGERCLTCVVNISLDERWFPLNTGDKPLKELGFESEIAKNGLRLKPLGFAVIHRNLSIDT